MVHKNNTKVDSLLVLLLTAIWLFIFVKGLWQMTDIISQVPENEQHPIQTCLDKVPNREYGELIGGYLQFSNLIMLVLFIEVIMRIGKADITAIREIIKKKDHPKEYPEEHSSR